MWYVKHVFHPVDMLEFLTIFSDKIIYAIFLFSLIGLIDAGNHSGARMVGVAPTIRIGPQSQGFFDGELVHISTNCMWYLATLRSFLGEVLVFFPTWMGVWYPPWKNCHRKMALNATFFDWSPPSDIFSDVYYTIVFDHLFGNLLSYIYIFWYAIWYSSSEIYSDILSDTHPEILPGLILWHSFWHVFWHIFWHSIWPFMIWHFIWHLIWHFLTSLAFCILKCLKYLLSCYFLFSIWHVLRLALLLLEAKLYTKSTLW